MGSDGLSTRGVWPAMGFAGVEGGVEAREGVGPVGASYGL